MNSLLRWTSCERPPARDRSPSESCIREKQQRHADCSHPFNARATSTGPSTMRTRAPRAISGFATVAAQTATPVLLLVVPTGGRHELNPVVGGRCFAEEQESRSARLLVVRICAARPRQAFDLLGWGSQGVGRGACARLTVWVRCARTPSRIWVHDRAVRPAGDMMVDGVIPLGGALRPLGRWRPSTRTWRQDDAGSRPRCIGVSEGCARKIDFTRVAAPAHRARAGCGSCA
jgi:hypothetical protein